MDKENHINSYEATVAQKRRQNEEFLRNLGLPQLTPKARQPRNPPAKKQLFASRSSPRILEEMSSVAESDASQPEGDMTTWDTATTKARLVERFPDYKEVLEDSLTRRTLTGRACQK